MAAVVRGLRLRPVRLVRHPPRLGRRRNEVVAWPEGAFCREAVNVPGQLFQVLLPVGGSRLGSGAVRVVQFMDRVRATTHQDG